MEKKLEIIGYVIETLPNGTFKVQTQDNKIIFAYLSGKLKKNFIKIYKGDKVLLLVSKYDLTKGIIKIRF